MAKIEIDLKEYNSFSEKINELQKKNGELINQLEKKNTENEELQEMIQIVKSVNLFDRLFNWKQILNFLTI